MKKMNYIYLIFTLYDSMPYILQLLENNKNKGFTIKPLIENINNNKISLQTIRDIDFSFCPKKDCKYTIILYKINNKKFIYRNWEFLINIESRISNFDLNIVKIIHEYNINMNNINNNYLLLDDNSSIYIRRYENNKILLSCIHILI
jgi:hypothetical protein